MQILEFISYFLSLPVFRNVALLFGVSVAVVSVRSAKSIAQKRQTAEFIFQSRQDERLMDGMLAIFLSHDDTDQNIRKFAQKDCVAEEMAKHIRYVLNHYEYLSVGIQHKIYNEKMMRAASWSTVINLYKRTKPYIEQVREVKQSNTIYQEFEWLACRWKENPLKAKETITFSR